MRALANSASRKTRGPEFESLGKKPGMSYVPITLALEGGNNFQELLHLHPRVRLSERTCLKAIRQIPIENYIQCLDQA